ncbi:MAG: ATP-binding protein [Marinovum sp.]|nr:ATP-binding protein [Marinovum sp.]
MAAALIVALANAAAHPWVEDRLIQRGQENSVITLGLVSDAVDQAIDRFKPIPGLVARDPVFGQLLEEPRNQGLVPFVNEKLRHLSGTAEVTEIYLIDRAGQTLAASNYREADSFVGNNFSFRPYFQDALSGETAQFHALGTTSGERGFFFAAPVLDGIDVQGVLAVKVTVDALEEAWNGVSSDVLVADGNGVVFLSSRQDYRMRSLAPLSQGARTQIIATRQFPLDVLTPIPFSTNLVGESAVEVVVDDGTERLSYLAASQPLTLPGWHSIVLAPLEPIRRQVLYRMGVGNLTATVLALIGLLIWQRRARVLERMRVQETQKELLEGMVATRTADLDAANIQLRGEIAERRAAEERLRRAQKDLVQAGKLAALGQMSAAISHEINQPLAAVKSYADNAAQYLERSQPQKAEANLSRISQMADRMAKISGHLRNFARRPGDALGAISLNDVVAEAIALMEPQLKHSECEVIFIPSEEALHVLGGRLRLQQVIINIMTNALDAMTDAKLKRIEIALFPGAETVSLHVRDTGPGLSVDTLGQAFEAFYTTKEAGSGMGLGLSISFNIIEDFGGKLTAENHPNGGAVFTVTLRSAEVQSPMVAQ